jgi:tetratricopeptide (TPR) repeat protein
MSAKLALTYIVKDNSELELFKKSLKSFMPYFDGLFVVVNGLSGEHDLIHKEVKKWKGTSISISPETHPKPYYKNEDGTWEFVNFAAVRQISFDMVTPDYDYISWADTDDLLQGGTEIRGLMNNAKSQGLDAVFCTYYYSVIFNDDGSVKEPVIFHERERFLKRGKYKWTSWLHEVCVVKEGDMKDAKMAQYTYSPEKKQNLVWIHTANYEKSSKALLRNVRILELQAKSEDYKDPRTIFYIAKTYFDINTDEKLIESEKYLDMYIPMSGWDEEIGNAYHYKGLIKQKQGKDKEAIPFYKEAIKQHPKNHLDYLRLADAYFKIGDFENFQFYLKLVPYLPEMQSKATIGSPFEVKILFLTLKYLEAEKQGKMEDMLHYAKLRHEYVKDTLLEQVETNIEINKIAEAIHNYAIFLIKYGLHREVLYLIETLPEQFQGQEFIKKVINRLPGKVHDDKSIVYFASFYQPHFEKWNGDSLKVGIGGSESAVIYLAEEWAKLGFYVVVYCDTPEDTVINGVLYVKYWKINWNDQFNVMITWRTPFFADFGFKTRKHFVDLHDIVDPTHWTPERIKHVDKVFFKSKWHSEQIPQLPDSKKVIISNGITL